MTQDFTKPSNPAILLSMKPKTKEQPMKTITVRMPEELVRAAKVHAARTGSQLQAVVAAALTAYLRAVRKRGEDA
jgi:predicted DNA binding CopG/RHH family protein